MKKNIAVVSIVLGCLVALSGCSPASSPTGTKHDNGNDGSDENYGMLVFSAIGTVGDGADDATIVIESTGTGDEGIDDYATILPWSRTIPFGGGNDTYHVSMTVTSLSSDGSVSCAVVYQNVTLKNTASGDHAVAVCEGDMVLD